MISRGITVHSLITEVNYDNNLLITSFIAIVSQGMYLVKISFPCLEFEILGCAFECPHLLRRVSHAHLDISRCDLCFQSIYTLILANLIDYTSFINKQTHKRKNWRKEKLFKIWPGELLKFSIFSFDTTSYSSFV